MMNSKTLAYSHGDDYRGFFTDNQVVLSFPLSMERSGTSSKSGVYEGIYLKQKLPIRVYIGITSTSQKKSIVFRKIRSYSIESDGFEYQEIDAKHVHYSSYFLKLGDYIGSRLDGYDKGMTIDILVEGSPKLGLAFFPTITFGVVMTALYYAGQVSKDDLLTCSASCNIDDIYRNSPIGEVMQDIMNFSRKTVGSISYLSTITTFFSSDSCFLSYRKNEGGLPEDFKVFAGTSIDRLYRDDAGPLVKPHSSFDVCVLYTGVPLQPNKRNISNNYTEHIALAKQHVLGKANKILIESSLFKSFFEQEVLNMDCLFARILEGVNIEILDALSCLTSNKFDARALSVLIIAINKILSLFTVSCPNDTVYMQTLAYIKHFLSSYKSTEVGILPLDLTRDGGVVSIISPLESNRKKVHQMIEEYRKMHPDSQMSIIYESRKDGYEYEGVKVEQDIRSGIFSDFIERGNCMIQHYDGSTQLIEHSQIALQTYDDIIVDTIHHKIYLPGHKLTSKDLHTQTSTSEILEIALQHLDADIPNTKLPVGAYAKNKNDMTAKVIIPLKKLVEKYCNKDLMFTCSGTLTSFSIRLSPGKVKFGIVKPLP